MGTAVAAPAQSAENGNRPRFRQVGLNRVIISGNLTHDPDLKQPKGGEVKVCVLQVAVNGPIPRTEGAEQSTLFVRVDVWGSRGRDGVANNSRPEAQAKHLRKGRPVTIEGRLKIDRPLDPQTGRIRDTYVTIVADQVIWGGAPPQQAPQDSVQAEPAGQPDNVTVEAAAPAPAQAAAADTVADDPAPY